jgi:hypothetical protein
MIAAFVGKYGAIASNQNWGFGGTTTRSSILIAINGRIRGVPSSDDLTSEKINKIVELFKILQSHCYRECELVGFLCSACLLWK